MNRKQIIIILVLAVFVVIVIITGLSRQQEGLIDLPDFPGLPGGGESKNSEEPISLPDELLLPDSTSTFTTEVPQDVELSKPTIEAPAAPNVKEKLGIFDMNVSKDGYDPLSITVKKGDLVQIRLTAVGGDYDFSMPYTGLYTFVLEGETKQISFGVTSSGTFVFQCRDHCPSEKIIKGQLIVLP